MVEVVNFRSYVFCTIKKKKQEADFGMILEFKTFIKAQNL